MASSSAGRSFFSFSRNRPWKVRLRSARPLLLIGLQTACLFHVIPTHLFEIRGCEGPSMLPTLSPQGDHLLTVRLPFVRFLEKLQAWGRGEGGGAGGTSKPWKTRVSKSDPTCGLPLRVGDIVVAASPRNPSRYVCKRIVGLAGDTVLIDPRVQLGATAGTPDGGGGAALDEMMEEVVRRSHEDGEAAEAEEVGSSAQPVPSSLIVSSVQRRGSDLYVTVPAGHVFLTGDNLSYSNDSRHYGPVPLGCLKGKVVARLWPSFTRFRSPGTTMLTSSPVGDAVTTASTA